jgi:serum/glucocorticoid-regulated kinase 2
LLITNFGLYNLKEKSTYHLNVAIKRRIDIDKIKAIIVSKIGTEFVVHVPSEYDYRYIISNLRYASSDRREQVIYYILKAYRKIKNDKLPVYYKD